MWGRNEIAIYGTTCQEIKSIVSELALLFPEKSIAYLDETHDEKVSDGKPYDQYTLNQGGCEAAIGLVDRYKTINRHYDLVVVNGNHFPASNQMVVVNPAKEASLLKRAVQLTNVVGLVNPSGDVLPEYILSLCESALDIPQFRFLEKNMELERILFPKPQVKALVLTGGKSERMGTNKSMLQYHGEPQFLWIANQATSLGIPTYMSVGASSLPTHPFEEIRDTFLDLGPMGGLLSAMRHDPNSAWLLLAVDMPALQSTHIKELLAQRETHFGATAYLNSTNGLPEPLFSIWEPCSYPELLHLLSKGISCPRKALLNMEKVKLLTTTDSAFLSNVNTPEEAERFKSA